MLTINFLRNIFFLLLVKTLVPTITLIRFGTHSHTLVTYTLCDMWFSPLFTLTFLRDIFTWQTKCFLEKVWHLTSSAVTSMLCPGQRWVRLSAVQDRSEPSWMLWGKEIFSKYLKQNARIFNTMYVLYVIWLQNTKYKSLEYYSYFWEIHKLSGKNKYKSLIEMNNWRAQE